MFKGQKSSKTEQGLLNSENLPPEVEIGNVEYKEKLINQSASRLEHLTSQMKWRLDEGGGEALYEIGVSDNGRLIGISLQEMDMSLNTLNLIARNLKATTRLLHTLKIQDRLVCEVLILAIRSLDLSEISLCVLESSLISVLSHEELDNGNGKARLHTLRYRHEIESGLTSSNSNQIMAFDSFGNVVKNSWNQDAILSASKLLTFIDTCGHFKYQKTTLSALVGSNADMFMLVQAANEPLSNEFIEYFKILNLMAVPMMACITKIDISSSEQVTRVILQLFSLLKSFNVTSRIIQNEKDIVSYKPDTLPLFFTSSVKSNFSNLTKFLFGIKVRSPVLSNEEVIFQSQHIFNLSNVGTVLSGLILTGQIDLESGPTSLLLQTGSKSIRVIVKSIERYKTRVYSASAGQLVTLALKFPIDDTLECHTWINHPPNNFTLKKGMILSNISFKPQKSFIADIKWLGLPNIQIESIIAGMLYIGYARKAVKLCPIANNRAKICFLADEIIIPPIKMIFVNSKMKCIVGLCDEH